MVYVTPSTVTAGTSPITAASYNVLTNDVIDHETRINDSGLVMITPTSVSGTGVTSSNGAITLTAATAPIINGIFTSAYENYKVVVSNISGSTSSLFSFRTVLAGTPATGATDYAYSVLQSASAGAWLNLGFSAGTSLLVAGYKVNGLKSQSNIDVYAPALAVTTQFVVSGVYGASPYFGGGHHSPSTAYDGLAIIPDSGNITATMRVYGYQNS